MFNSSILSFGLDISELSLKAVQLVKRGRSFYLQAWDNTKMPEGVIVDGKITKEQTFIAGLKKLIKNCAGRLTTNYVVLCLPETRIWLE